MCRFQSVEEKMTITKAGLFQIFKYVVYGLLVWNGVIYFFQGVNSADFIFQNELSWYDRMIAYSSVIDTTGWLVLILIFELETYILEDDVLKGFVWFVFNTIVVLIWLVIFSAFYSYVVKLGIPWGFDAYTGVDPCQLTTQGASFAVSLDDYTELTAQNCLLLQEGALHNQSLNMFTTPAIHDEVDRLVWVDIVNAGVWLLIVAMIQLEVYLESSRHVGTRAFFYYKAAKYALYAVLFVCAYYWIRLGDIVAGWDAFVWLAAFFFIERNLLDWQQEVAAEREAGQAVEAKS
jgi:hypothetical protein